MKRRPVIVLGLLAIVAVIAFTMKKTNANSGFQILGVRYSDNLKSLYEDVRKLTGKEVDFIPSNTKKSEARSHGERVTISLAKGASEATVAHELMHSILYGEGYPQMFFCSSKAQAAHGLINASFDHLIINQRLRARNFDYKPGIAIIPSHTPMLRQAIEPGEKGALTTVLLLHQLIKFVIYAERPNTESDFLRAYPSLGKYWHLMRQQIEKVQLNPTPEKMWDFYVFHQTLCGQIAFESDATLDVLKYMGVSPFLCPESDAGRVAKDLFGTRLSEQGGAVLVTHKASGLVLASLRSDEGFVQRILGENTVSRCLQCL